MSETLKWVRQGLMVMSTLIITACATQIERPSGVEVVSAQAWFAEHPVWSVSGRVALSDGESGGQLNITWADRQDHVEVVLRSRLGGRWWRLVFNDEQAQLSAHDRPTERLGDADELVAQATGWPVPVTAMHDWIRGLEVPPKRAGDAANGVDDAIINDGGWRVEVTEHGWVTGAAGQAVRLPKRLQAERPPHRIRVVFGEWEWAKNQPNG